MYKRESTGSQNRLGGCGRASFKYGANLERDTLLQGEQKRSANAFAVGISCRERNTPSSRLRGVPGGDARYSCDLHAITSVLLSEIERPVRGAHESSEISVSRRVCECDSEAA